MFDRYTKRNARRKYRLLIVDGHGSHLTMDFIRYCDDKKILLAVFPPHSTHTLQPLDVACFKPLSSEYKNELTNGIHQSQGILPIKKGDFFPLFWKAWVASFTEKTILNSFKATGISPLNADVILNRFTSSNPGTSESQGSSTSCYSGEDWLKIQSLIRSVAKDESSKETRKLRRSLHHLTVSNQLLHHDMEGLREALKIKKKHKKKAKILPLQQREEYHGGAVFWSPSKRREAEVRYDVMQRMEKEEQVQKADRKQLQVNNKLLKERLLEEKRVAREVAKGVREKEKAAREKEKAEQAAEKECQRQSRDAVKAIQLSQNGKRKISRPPIQKNKRQKRVDDAVGSSEATEALPSPLPVNSRRGRSIKLPNKHK